MADNSQRPKGIWQSFRAHWQMWVTLSYLYASAMSAFYAWSYYGTFHINIFNFTGPSDFLLMVFSDLSTSFQLAGCILFFALSVLLLGYAASKLFGKDKPEQPALKPIQRPTLEKLERPSLPELPDSRVAGDNKSWKDWIRTRPLVIFDYAEFVLLSIRPCAKFVFFWTLAYNKLVLSKIVTPIKFAFFWTLAYTKFALSYLKFSFFRSLAFAILFILLGPALLVPYCLGKWNSQRMLKENSSSVQVTFRQDVAHPVVNSQSRTLQLGTTSSFLFLYSFSDTEGRQETSPVSVPQETAETSISRAFKELPVTVLGETTVEAFNTLFVCAIEAFNSLLVYALEFLNTLFATVFGEAAMEALKKYFVNFFEALSTLFIAFGEKIPAGRTFIVPMANLASLAPIDNSDPQGFRPSKVSPPQNDDSPEVEKLPCSSWEKPGIIGPFPEARHKGAYIAWKLWTGEIDNLSLRFTHYQTKPTGDKEFGLMSLEEFESKINFKFKAHTLQQLMLIGRVDSRPFNDSEGEYYGSQRGLAQARAEWVQEQLLKKFSKEIDPGRITLLSDNYLYEAEEKRALDRSVEVYACWSPKPERGGSSADSAD